VLLLRASGEVSGRSVDVHAVTDPARADESGVPHAAVLLALADAMVGDDEAALGRARTRVRETLGDPQLVDAAAVVSNFERMVRIADATGIPLDGPVDMLTAAVRTELGIDRFTAAANTPPAGPLRRVLAPLLRPVLRRVLHRVGRRGL
jgi:hypothetical protein